jgi:acyl carrier protein
MRDVFEKFLEEHTGKPRSEINDSASFRDDLGLDSLSIAMLYPDVEDLFHITFSPLDDDLGEIFSTVGSLWAFLSQRGSLS